VTPSNVAGIVCAPRPPQGFQGPLAFYTVKGSPLPAAPPCIDQYEPTPAYDGNADVSAPAGECKCECDPSSTTPCGSPVITLFSDTGCMTPCGPAQPVPTKAAAPPLCGTMDAGACIDPTYAKVAAARPGGACTPKSIGLPPPHSWGSVARLCEPKKDIVAECDADKVLAPITKFPYQTDNYCLLTTLADAECPPTYPKKSVFYDSDKFLDERSCGECTCAPPTGSCGGSVVTTDDPSTCSGGVDSFDPLPAGCQNIEKSRGFAYTPGPDAGVSPRCDPGGGGPTGSLQPTAATTICCRF
jgi:hypothetical protein